MNGVLGKWSAVLKQSCDGDADARLPAWPARAIPESVPISPTLSAFVWGFHRSQNAGGRELHAAIRSFWPRFGSSISGRTAVPGRGITSQASIAASHFSCSATARIFLLVPDRVVDVVKHGGQALPHPQGSPRRGPRGRSRRASDTPCGCAGCCAPPRPPRLA